ncbi:MAG: ABC transporter permease [Gammaproteobacteria bacterium]|nr:ABC transporter permease [Gammaproteobacteria bacterium]MCY4343742.1 ABC transporter permease [Gammaproteobacteria bacterium]
MTPRRTKDILLYKTYAELKAEAQRNFLGFLWWVIEPILFMLVFYFVFGRLLGARPEAFIPFLLVGLVVWLWGQATITQGASAITANHGLLNQAFVPKVLFPTVIFLKNTFKFLFALLMLLIFLVAYGIEASLIWLEAIPVLAVGGLFVLGSAYLACALTPFFPDLQMLIDNGLRMLFFMSGIFYDIDTLSTSYKAVFQANPAAVLIDSLRSILLAGEHADWWRLGGVLVGALCVGGAGYAIMRVNESRYAKIAF